MTKSSQIYDLKGENLKDIIKRIDKLQDAYDTLIQLKDIECIDDNNKGKNQGYTDKSEKEVKFHQGCNMASFFQLFEYLLVHI